MAFRYADSHSQSQSAVWGAGAGGSWIRATYISFVFHLQCQCQDAITYVDCESSITNNHNNNHSRPSLADMHNRPGLLLLISLSWMCRCLDASLQLAVCCWLLPVPSVPSSQQPPLAGVIVTTANSSQEPPLGAVLFVLMRALFFLFWAIFAGGFSTTILRMRPIAMAELYINGRDTVLLKKA